MRIVSVLFWGAVSVTAFLIIAVFLLRLVRRYGGPLACVAGTVAGAAGVAA